LYYIAGSIIPLKGNSIAHVGVKEILFRMNKIEINNLYKAFGDFPAKALKRGVFQKTYPF
jgi:hypothetical protein